MGLFFWRKSRTEKEIERLKEVMKTSFLSVKDDLNKVSHWISYLNEKDKELDVKIENLNMKIEDLAKEIEEIKEFLAVSGSMVKGVFKQHKQVFKQQTGVYGVQTPVQTGVQTPRNIILQNLTLTERAILWILLNSDLKLSCEDIARVLGKSENTVRGQINSIKTKWSNLISEIIEKNGKKRYYIEEKTKDFLLKKLKVRVKKRKKSQKT